MAAVANNPKFAKKAGVPQSVGEEFMKADKGKPMKKMMKGGMTSMKSVAKKEVKGHEERMHGKKMAAGGMAKYAKGGSIDGCATKGKTKGKMVKMAKGGMTKSGCK